MRIDLTGVEDRSFELLPAGRYLASLTDYTNGATQGKPGAKLPAGVPMINWEFTLKECLKLNGGGDPQDVKCENRKLWMNSIIHQTTLFNIKRLLKATALYEEEDLQGSIDFDPDEVISKAEDVILVVSDNRVYNDEKQNDVKRVVGLHEDTGSTDSGSSSMLP